MNALEFSKSEGCVVQIFVTADQNGLLVEIIDDGIGISEKDMPYVLIHFSPPRPSGSAWVCVMCGGLSASMGGVYGLTARPEKAPE